jgi:hypothetical protein
MRKRFFYDRIRWVFQFSYDKEFVAMLLKHPEALGTSLINLEGYFCDPSW